MTVLSNVWTNADGLFVKFGAEEGAVGKVGSYEDTWGQLLAMTLHIDYTDIAASPAIMDYTTVLPAGSRVYKVEVLCETAATGTNAVLNVGLIQMDGSTELDYNGLIAAVPLTSIDAAGEQYDAILAATYAGALIGTTTSVDGFFTADYDTAAFTAGKWVVTVWYYKTLTT